MSWSATSIELEAGEEVTVEKLGLAESEAAQTYEVKQQLQAACDAINLIAKSGALGEGVRLSVSCGGHANPDHAPRDGWSNDSLNIALFQR